MRVVPLPGQLLSFEKKRLGHRHAQRQDPEETWGGDSCLQAEERGPRMKPNLSTPWSWVSRLQNEKKINFCCLSHPAGAALLWQP